MNAHIKESTQSIGKIKLLFHFTYTNNLYNLCLVAPTRLPFGQEFSIPQATARSEHAGF